VEVSEERIARPPSDASERSFRAYCDSVAAKNQFAARA
jgi:hypothetical protein